MSWQVTRWYATRRVRFDKWERITLFVVIAAVILIGGRYPFYIVLAVGVPVIFASSVPTGWEKERSQVQEWLSALNSGDRAQDVTEVFTGSFWTGYFTYRLLKTGYCWVIAKFKKGAAGPLIDFRIRELETVRVTGLDDKLIVEIANRPIGRPTHQCGTTRSGS